MVTTSTILTVNTKLVFKLNNALSVKSKEDQRIATHVFQELKTNAHALKDSTMLSGNAKNVLSVLSETHKPTNVLQLHHVTPQAKLEEVQKHAMLVHNNKNHHVHVHKDSIQIFGNVKNVLSDGEMTDKSTNLTVDSTTTTLVHTKPVLKLQDASSVKSKEDQRTAMDVFQDLYQNADVLKDSTMLSGNAKNVLSVSSETHKPTNVLQLHHVTLQAKLETVQKHAMLVDNK